MTWIEFLCWLAGFYSCYYVGNILWDVTRSRQVMDDGAPELVFEQPEPERVVVAEKKVAATEKPLPPVIDSGGLRLRQLFAAAKAETIVYTGGVTY